MVFAFRIREKDAARSSVRQRRASGAGVLSSSVEPERGKDIEHDGFR
jgi:hypothetical protein